MPRLCVQRTTRLRRGDADRGTRPPSKDEVLAHLHRQKLIPVSVREKPKELSFTFGSGVSTRDIVIFTRQFATMINSGLPLVQSLDILAEQTENQALRKTICGRSLRRRVRPYARRCDGQARQVFTELYVNMVAAGEAGGILDTILLRLATFLEKNDALIRKIKGAMIYPGVIFSVAGGAIVICCSSSSRRSSRCSLRPGSRCRFRPRSSSRCRNSSRRTGGRGCRRHRIRRGPAAVLPDRQWTAGARQAVAGDAHLGDLQRKSAVARFTRTLGTLVSSGVSILEGLEITAKTAGNRVIHDAVMGSRASIAGGETIAGPLKESGVFPPMVVQMINVGEQTGGLDEMLTKIADFYDEEVDAAVDALLSALEPIMIVVLGVVVGGMIVAMYLPIFDMINAVQ